MVKIGSGHEFEWTKVQINKRFSLTMVVNFDYSMIFSDFLESDKQIASLSDSLQWNQWLPVNMASSQLMISVPCYEGFLKFQIWQDYQSVSKFILSPLTIMYYGVSTFPLFSECQLLWSSVKRTHHESKTRCQENNLAILPWVQVCCYSWS